MTPAKHAIARIQTIELAEGAIVLDLTANTAHAAFIDRPATPFTNATGMRQHVDTLVTNQYIIVG